jgi:hypothetical protein
MFAEMHDFKTEGSQTIPEDGDDGAQGNNASDPTSSYLGSCRCSKKCNFASRQFDRSPIKKDERSQATAAELRKSFFEIGRLIKLSRRSNLFEVQEDSPIPKLILSIENLIYEKDSNFLLLPVLGLATLCAQPFFLAKEFGVEKARLLLSYSGEFLGQLAGSNSVLTLMKPGAKRGSLAFCEAFEKAEKNESAVHEAKECLAVVKSLGKSRLATPGQMAATLTTLLDFVRYGEEKVNRIRFEHVFQFILLHKPQNVIFYSLVVGRNHTN